MNHNNRDLLREVLDRESLEEFRRASLATGLEFIRRRHRRRTVAKACAVVGLPLLGALAMVSYENVTWSKGNSKLASPAGVVAADSNPSNDLQIINDEQLFALFPNQALALVGKPGHQQLVFLDQSQPEQPAVER
jgi:hypothetical protein